MATGTRIKLIRQLVNRRWWMAIWAVGLMATDAGRAKACNKEGMDVTGHFLQGAELALEKAQKHGVKVAILKANSPSCGNVQIYSGRFDGEKVPGAGVAAALLMENGIKVYSEQEIDEDLLKRLIEEDRG